METKRILIVDDNESIHEDIHNVLGSKAKRKKDSETVALEEELFGESPKSSSSNGTNNAEYVIDDAYQGADAVKMVDKAAEEGFPYALIFMDVRMPPGIDGIQAVTEIWRNHPQIEVVICTAYSDYTWDEIVEQFGPTDHLLFMKKPFDSISLKQTAISLTTKWDYANRNRLYVEKLEFEIGKRTDELDSMSTHLQEIKKDSEEMTIAKFDYFSNVTTELKTPLNGILGITDLLLDTDLSDEQRNYAETIKTSGSSLLLIITDILDYSKTLARPEEASEISFDLRTTLESVIDLISAAAQEKEIEIACLIDCEVNDFFIGDPFKLRHVLLLAISYFINSTGSCEIIISVINNEKKEDTEVRLLFEISKLRGEAVEGKKKQNANSQTSEGYLDFFDSKKFAEKKEQAEELTRLIGGEFGSKFDEETGESIWFTALLAPKEQTKLPSVVVPSTIIGMRCLVISDYSTGRKVLSLHINHWGGICREASLEENIVEKISSAQEGNVPFDAVIVDLKNEKIDVYDNLVRDVFFKCEQKRIQPPKLICLTANAHRGDAQKIKEYGFNAYLTKPIKQSHLYKTLLLVKSLKDGNQDLDPSTLITKHYVDELTPDFYKVLIIAEKETDLTGIVTNLMRLKVRCDVSYSREIALTSLIKKKYDLVLIDCASCHKIDVDYLGKLKKSKPTLSPVFLINSADKELKKYLDKQAQYQYLVKPIDKSALIELLKKEFKD